ncbi:ABC transporter substrate-binding protein [Marinomonas balearica]|uniref:Iron complex transport system substrate-binding protein n=1 Tax=Marinomonas balearica TaxID=491947 RepID=A0A4R6MJS4_9GAMM|nr:ABC transporter substrate-binding protein [Marinomonas balearica]TDP00510.1 iron complex transport system substrate-binding protein [Marinomonas balearica]
MVLKKLSRTVAIGVVALSFNVNAKTDYPVTIENCGTTQVYERAPTSVVTIGQAATEILYSLGLAETVKGTSVWFNDVLPEYATVDADIPRLADNDPSFEAVLGQRPEFVAAQYEWHVGKQGTVATREQFHDIGISTYNLPMDCDNKDNSVGPEGTRLDLFSTSSLYKSVTQLSTIFNVPEKGNELVRSLKSRERNAIERAKKAGADGRSAVFWFSSAAMEIDPFVAGQKGAAGYIMKTLGIKNVVQSDEEWPTVGWETIAKANPDIIVIAKMKRRRFPADDYHKKLEFLRSDPVTKEMKAVKNGNIIVMDALEMDSSIRVIRGLEQLTQAVEDIN